MMMVCRFVINSFEFQSLVAVTMPGAGDNTWQGRNVIDAQLAIESKKTNALGPDGNKFIFTR